jgi:hypothetical protein
MEATALAAMLVGTTFSHHRHLDRSFQIAPQPMDHGALHIVSNAVTLSVDPTVAHPRCRLLKESIRGLQLLCVVVRNWVARSATMILAAQASVSVAATCLVA